MLAEYATPEAQESPMAVHSTSEETWLIRDAARAKKYSILSRIIKLFRLRRSLLWDERKISCVKGYRPDTPDCSVSFRKDICIEPTLALSALHYPTTQDEAFVSWTHPRVTNMISISNTISLLQEGLLPFVTG